MVNKYKITFFITLPLFIGVVILFTDKISNVDVNILVLTGFGFVWVIYMILEILACLCRMRKKDKYICSQNNEKVR